MLAASVFLILACGDYAGESPLEPTPPPPEPSPSNEVSFVVHPKSLEVRVGKTGDLEAELSDGNGQPVSGFTVHWETPDPPVAEVDDQGTVYGNGADSVYVTAEAIRDSDGMLFVDSALVAVTGSMKPARELEVEPDSVALEPGTSRALGATAKDSKGNPQNRKVHWESSSPDVATVDDSGLVSAVGSGEATITARSGGLEEQVPVVVEQAAGATVAQVELSPASMELEVGQSGALEATVKDADGNVLDRPVGWRSSDASVASVDGDGGVSAEVEGEATITATSEGVSSSATVTVTSPSEEAAVATVSVSPSSLELEEGQSGALEATVKDADGDVLDRSVSWSSSDASVAKVDGNGGVSAEAEGEATITATSESVSGSATVTVTSPSEEAAVATVSVTPSSLELEEGLSGMLEATLKDADGNVLDRAVEWSTSDASVASVTDDGMVTAESEGEATITATSEGESGTAAISVASPSEGPTTAGSVYPNEPGSYEPVVEFDGSIVPPHYQGHEGGMEDPPLCDSPALDYGCIVAHENFTNGPHRVISDPSAPIDSDVMRVVFPEGGTGSPGFVNLWGRQHDQLTALARSRARPDGFELEKMYYSARFRLTSGPGDGTWEIGTFGGSHLKILGYISVGDRPGAALYPLRIDTVDEPYVSSAEAKFMQQGPTSVDDKTKWVSSGTIRVGEWHHLELVMESNDLGQANGLLVIYLDGVEQSRVETVEYRTAEHPHGFHIVHMNQVWGNATDTRTRTDYVDIDHLYVSGVELK